MYLTYSAGLLLLRIGGQAGQCGLRKHHTYHTLDLFCVPGTKAPIISVAQIRPPGGSYAHKGLHTAPWGPEAPTHRARTAEGRYTQGRRPPHTGGTAEGRCTQGRGPLHTRGRAEGRYTQGRTLLHTRPRAV